MRFLLKQTGDVTLAEEVYGKLLSVLNVFIGNRKDWLVCKFEGANHWKFYDWSHYLDGALFGSEEVIPDLMINVLFILALQNLREIDRNLGQNFVYDALLSEAKAYTRKAFYRQKVGLFSMTVHGNVYCAW